MANLSQKKREKMLAFLETLKAQHSDDESLIALGEIERELKSRKYGLVWEEHEEKVDVKMRSHIPVFTADDSKEIHADTTNDSYNFILEGDNLHSLRLLEKTHRNKVDIIYIDPPYNRGKNDFIYDDNYIAEEDGFKHSKWLSFMEKRLSIAKKILSKNGLLFISIDDNEIAQIKMLCDQLFCFINLFVWQRNSSEKTEKGKFTVNTEYILLYANSPSYHLCNAFKPLSEASQKLYKYDDNDGRGKYQTVSLQKPKDPGPETTYDYVDNNGKVWKCPAKGWRMKQSKIKDLENDGRLVLTGNTLRVKDYWNERDNPGKRIDTLWNDLSQNTAGSGELEAIIGKPDSFDNPKPTDLIRRCLTIAGKSSVVLDFFAGSGTTGQAVLEMNIEDGGNRKFILCTNNQNGICENVTYQRMKTFITGKRSDGSEYSNGTPANLIYYRTDFVDKELEGLSDELLVHIREMIQLEHGIKIDDRKYVVILTEEEMDDFERNFADYPDLQGVFINSDIFMSARQQKMLKDVDSYVIPDYYFDFELREAGEIW